MTAKREVVQSASTNSTPARSRLKTERALSSDLVPADARPVAPADLALPLTSRALFWRPRHTEKGRGLVHLPFLFWLVEALRPQRLVQIGLEDPAGYLSLCQAVDKAGIETICLGLEPDPGKPALNESTTSQHTMLYGDFSFVFSEDPGRAIRHLRGSTLDLLVIDTRLDAEMVALLRAHWLPLMSERGVMVIHDPETRLASAEARQFLDEMVRACPAISFPQTKPGLEAILLGREPPERLSRLAALQPGMPEYLPARQIFSQIGLGIESEQLAKTRQIALTEAVTAREKLEARLKVLEADKSKAAEERKDLLLAEAQHEVELAGLRAQIFDLQQALHSRSPEAEVSALRDELVAAARRAAETAEAQEAISSQLKVQLKEANNKHSGTVHKLEAVTAEKARLETEKAEVLAELDRLRSELVLAQTECTHAKEVEYNKLRERYTSLLAENQDELLRLREQLHQARHRRVEVWQVKEQLRAENEALLARLGRMSDRSQH